MADSLDQQKDKLLKQCETYLDLMEHDGWLEFIKELKGIKEIYLEQEYHNAADLKQFHEAKGYLKCLNQILAFEGIIRASVDGMKKVEGKMTDPLLELLQETGNTLEL